jgi:uncharacterized iron-regulated protein
MHSRSKILLLSFLVIILPALSALKKPDKPAYKLYAAEKSKAVRYAKMMETLQQADVVFFGELHNNPISHWLQLQILKDLQATHGKLLMLGAEMFEADNQLILDEYMQGLIREDQLIREARMWDNYKTDYAPLVRFVRDNELRCVATNVPRRYASMVSRGGMDILDSLSQEALRYCAPLPVVVDYELPGYREMQEMMAVHGGRMGSAEYFVAAQALKDATMAHFIAVHMEAGSRMLHLNGSYHSNRGEGILHYLRLLRPELKLVTIATVEQEQIDSLASENRPLADFLLVVPSDMTKTY